jgi:hypothetical protein
MGMSEHRAKWEKARHGSEGRQAPEQPRWEETSQPSAGPYLYFLSLNSSAALSSQLCLLTKNQKARLRAGAMLWENKAFLS